MSRSTCWRAATATAAFAGAATASPPTPDKIVIVLEENHSLSQVIGSSDAPCLNSLAAAGATFTAMFAVTHPSQPNYIQFFSGANQGVLDDTVPAPGVPWTAANLAASLVAAGRTFAGYSEDLPAIGSTVGSSGGYRRKHNPWVNWQADPPGPHQLPSTFNRPFFTSDPTPRPFFGDADAPSDYSGLPTVSIVVPNLLDDMHDGTVAQADAWLQAHIAPYATWAMTHNSLLIITWDEDNSAAGNRNRIPTILVGPMVRPGTIVDSTWTLHSLLRTVEEMYGISHSGEAALTTAAVGAFSSDPATTTLRFQQGVGGYAGTHDAYIEAGAPGATHGADALLVADGSPLSQCLIRFDSFIGTGPGQVSAGVQVVSAKLLLLTQTGSSDPSQSTMSLHRMLVPWTEASSWSTFSAGGAGVQADGIEAATPAGYTCIPNVAGAWAIFDVTASVQAWVDGTASNNGWVVIPSGTDGWRWASAEAAIADRPLLEITLSTCRADWDRNGRLEAADVAAYVNAWFAAVASGTIGAADLSGDGQVTPADVAVFVANWFAALSGLCP